jgi:hypothetical protein
LLKANMQYTLGYFVLAQEAMVACFCTHFVLNSPAKRDWGMGLGLNIVSNNKSRMHL